MLKSIQFEDFLNQDGDPGEIYGKMMYDDSSEIFIIMCYFFMCSIVDELELRRPNIGNMVGSAEGGDLIDDILSPFLLGLAKLDSAAGGKNKEILRSLIRRFLGLSFFRWMSLEIVRDKNLLERLSNVFAPLCRVLATDEFPRCHGFQDVAASIGSIREAESLCQTLMLSLTPINHSFFIAANMLRAHNARIDVTPMEIRNIMTNPCEFAALDHAYDFIMSQFSQNNYVVFRIYGDEDSSISGVNLFFNGDSFSIVNIGSDQSSIIHTVVHESIHAAMRSDSGRYFVDDEEKLAVYSELYSKSFFGDFPDADDKFCRIAEFCRVDKMHGRMVMPIRDLTEKLFFRFAKNFSRGSESLKKPNILCGFFGIIHAFCLDFSVHARKSFPNHIYAHPLCLYILACDYLMSLRFNSDSFASDHEIIRYISDGHDIVDILKT